MKTKTPYVKLLRLFFLLFLLTSTNTIFSQLLVNASFEGTNPWAGFDNGQHCCSHSVTQSSTIFHDGTKSFRAEVRANDPAVSSGWRAELVPNYSGGDAGDMWYGFSVYFETPVSGGNWTGSYGGHYIQWHPDNSSGSLSFGLWGSDGYWDVVTNPEGDETAVHHTTPASGGSAMRIVANVWHNVVLHVNWSTGVTQFWLNGVLHTNITVPWSSGPGRYLKFGMNRWGNGSGGAPTNTWVIYYDNLKIGRNVTYNDVAPSSSNPPANQPPVANAGNNITLTLPANSTTLVGSGTDADGTIASYAWSRVSGPTTFTLGTANAATTTLSNLVAGTYVFRLTVTDNGGATATDDVTVTVNAATNQPPTANAGSDITLTLPVNSTTLLGSGTDADGTIAGYAWARVSGPTTFTLGTANAATTTLSNLVAGTYVFRLTVTDNGGATGTDNVTVTVNAATNQPPTANAGSDITLTLPVNSTTLNGSGADADGTIAGYAWARVSGPTTFTLGTANAATTTLSNLVAGTYVFRLTVTDNSGATATDNVTVTVNAAVNQPPTANAGSDITLTLPVNSTTLNGSGADADGTIVGYAWARVSGPTTFTLGTANAATTTLSNLVAGTYVFRLTVTDNNGATATDNVTVTVNAAPPPAGNQPPTANAGSDITLTLPVNSTTLNGSGADADGTIAGYAWARVSGPTTFTLGTANAATTTLSNLVAGTYVFRLTVTDNGGATGTDNVTVTVNAAVNQPPTANAGSDITITLPVNSTTLNGSGADADGTIAGYAWARISGPTTFALGAANAATTTLSNLIQGVYVFRLTVTDNSGATATDNVTVTVNAAANQSPTANAGSDITLTLPVNSTSLNGSGSDPDGTITGYAWTRISGPTTFALGTANAATTTLTNLVQGVYTFRLTVTDNSGTTATDNVTVTVNAAPTAGNQPPTARTDNDMVLTLPINSALLHGNTSSDPDGVIVSYAWTQVSGPGQATITNGLTAIVGISDLTLGVYVFQLQVTDNGGASSTKTITVTVENQRRQKTTLTIYPNPVSGIMNMKYVDNENGKLRITIYDANRKLMRDEVIDKTQATIITTIDISEYGSGVYFIQVMSPDNKKIVKQVVKM